MTEKQIIEKLRGLHSIKPNEEYARLSKADILALPKNQVRSWEVVGKGIVAESFNFGLSLVFAAVLLVVVLGGATGILKHVLIQSLPGVDTQSLISEADVITKDIDIYLNEVEYYAVAAEKASIALNEASINGPAHVNPILIEKEIDELDFENPTNDNIDKLLEFSL